jgi:hypothetical protein
MTIHRAADLVDKLRFDFDLGLALRQLFFGLDLRALDLEQVELVAQEAVLHVAVVMPPEKPASA